MGYQVSQIQPHILIIVHDNCLGEAVLAGTLTKMKNLGDCSPEKDNWMPTDHTVQKRALEREIHPTAQYTLQTSLSAVLA